MIRQVSTISPPVITDIIGALDADGAVAVLRPIIYYSAAYSIPRFGSTLDVQIPDIVRTVVLSEFKAERLPAPRDRK
jgi:hypothetical protein